MPDAQSLVIKPYDTSTISSIEKAILQSDIGLTIRKAKPISIVIPPLNEERRKKIGKQRSREAAKVSREMSDTTPISRPIKKRKMAS